MIKKRKLLTFLISLLAAVVFWIYVVTTIAPDTTGSVYGVKISVYNDTVLTARNLVVTGYGPDTVRVDLEASRATLSKLNAGNVLATLDVSRITEPGEYDLSYTIGFPDTVNSGEINIRSKSVETIHIKVSELATKSLPIELRRDGQVQEGYLFDAAGVIVAPEKVEVKGPAEEIAKLDSAIVKYDVSNLEETAVEKLPIVFLDAEEREISFPDVMVSANVTETSVTLPVLRLKDIRLSIEPDYGEGTGINEQNVKVSIEPETIRVSGEKDVIEALEDVFTVDKIDLSRYDSGAVVKLPISLPAGVNNVSGVEELTVTIRYNGLTTQTYTVASDNFEKRNVPEGYQATVITESLNVKLRGSLELLRAISPEQIHIVIDFANDTRSETYSIPVSVRIDGNPSVGVVGSPTVWVELTPE